MSTTSMFKDSSCAAYCQGNFMARMERLMEFLLHETYARWSIYRGYSATTAEKYVMCNTTRRNDELISQRCTDGGVLFDNVRTLPLCERQTWEEGYSTYICGQIEFLIIEQDSYLT